MSYTERKALIRAIEEKRQSKIITLILSDRPSTWAMNGLQASIAADQVDQIITQLKTFQDNGHSLEKIEILIYSRGGDINTAWILVNTVRNYAKEFNLLVPVFSHSSATLIALGANSIVMTKTASLSPIDPTVANEFNPKENNISKGISVEDVTSFMSLAKDKDRVGIEDQEYITEVFKLLAAEVHPLALGNVKRSHTQIRILAKKLLELHIGDDNSRVEQIVDSLTEKFYSHYHLIFRDEAKNIGLTNIVNADEEEEKLLWNLYKDYEGELKLKEIFDINVFLGEDEQKIFETKTVYIESTEKSLFYNIKYLIKKTLIADVNHRLQVIAAENQYKLNAGNLINQLSNIINSLSQINLQVGTNPGLNTISQTNQQIITLLQSIINQVPIKPDFSDLKLNIETKILEIGWNLN